MGGAAVILPADGEADESEINLELLFNFAHVNPQKIKSIFNK